MTAIAAPLHRFTLWTRANNTGASYTAEKLTGFINNSVSALRTADTWYHIAESIDSLNTTLEECSRSNWDGYGAEAISIATYREAFTFLDSLPSLLPVPEITPEPDGSLGFEWSNGPDRIFAASVNGSGLIVYAGLFGKGNKSHGTENFNDSIPSEIIEKVKRVFS